MASTFLAVMITAVLACIITLIGIFVIYHYSKWGKKYVVYFMYFAAGVLISVSFLHIIPKSIELNIKLSPVFLLGGFLLLYIIDKIIAISKKQAKKKSLGIVSAIGIGIHSFIDGLIYSVAFSVSFFTGILTVIGMILHEFPEGIITFLLLFKSGFKKSKSAVYASLAAGISTPLGAVIAYPFISVLKEDSLGILLALSAGALIYVGATKLLPEANLEYRKCAWLFLFLGILVAVGIILLKG